MSSVDLHRANFRDHGGEHGQESEEGKEDKEDSQEEKEIIRSMKASEARHAFAIRTGGSFLWRNIRATNDQAGPLCRWLLHNGPGFSLNEQIFAKDIATDPVWDPVRPMG
jgi:hypothetical protein